MPDFLKQANRYRIKLYEATQYQPPSTKALADHHYQNFITVGLDWYSTKQRVRQFLNEFGVSVCSYAAYLAFAGKCFRLKTKGWNPQNAHAEIQALKIYYQNLGLTPALLTAIVNQVFFAEIEGEGTPPPPPPGP